jgi:lipoprotein-anchoring transpeptidase ErfK/SrfK
VNAIRSSIRLFCVVLTAGSLLPALVHGKSEPKGGAAAQEDEQMLKLQVFLDDSGFRPGVIDGRWGEFTRKALTRYLRAQGKEPEQFDEKKAPSELDLPFDANRPALTTYQITAEDEKNVGELAEKPEEQAKLKSLPYATVAEVVGEKFHAKVEYLKKLNPDATWKAGESVQVPNVQSVFDLSAVQEAKKKAAGGKSKDRKKPSAKGEASDEATTLSVLIDTKEKMLDLMEGDRIVGSVPITPGSERLPAPTGEWKVERVVWMPPFRWDKEMLMKGKRGDNAHELPPGPNSPVGILWTALSKDGIGVHGTAEPETIGRSTSHGCIRLANWDAFEIGQKLSPGAKVTIR